MSDFSAFETPDPNPYHKAYRSLWEKGWVAAMGDAFIVYETLRMHANHQTGLCYPKHKTLLRETGIKSVNTLRKKIDLLVTLGVVQIVKEPTPNTPTEYRVITAPYLPFYSEDQILTPMRGSNIDTREDQNLTVRGSNIDTREDQNLTVRGSNIDTREDQNLIPNKNKRTRPINKTHSTTEKPKEKTENPNPSSLAKKDQPTEQTNHPVKDPYARRRQSVLLTAKQQAKAMIEEVCDWDRFFKARKQYLESCDHYKNSNIRVVEGTVLKAYADVIERGRSPFATEEEKTLAIAKVKEMIQDHAESYGLISDAQRPQQSGLNGELARLLELHKKDPAQALKQAQGNPVIYNKFLKQAQTNA